MTEHVAEKPEEKGQPGKAKQLAATVKQSIINSAVRDESITKLYQTPNIPLPKPEARVATMEPVKEVAKEPAKQAGDEKQENRLVREPGKIHKVVAMIAGGEYTICGLESEEHLKGIAAIVDNKMLDLKRQYSNQSLNRLAILSALQLADEYVKLSDEYDKLVLRLERQG